MERVQSKFVIVKQMKELRFCEGLNFELDHLWTSKQALLASAPTPSPISVSVCLNYVAPINPEIKPHGRGKKMIKYNKLCNFPASLNSYSSSTLCPDRLSASPFCGYKIANGAWGPPCLVSAMTPAQEALRLVNQQLKACL